jgi:hypothetical protein
VKINSNAWGSAMKIHYLLGLVFRVPTLRMSHKSNVNMTEQEKPGNFIVYIHAMQFCRTKTLTLFLSP